MSALGCRFCCIEKLKVRARKGTTALLLVTLGRRLTAFLAAWPGTARSQCRRHKQSESGCHAAPAGKNAGNGSVSRSKIERRIRKDLRNAYDQ